MQNKTVTLLIINLLLLNFSLTSCEKCVGERQSAWMRADQIAFHEDGTAYIDTNKGPEQVNAVEYDAATDRYFVESIHE